MMSVLLLSPDCVYERETALVQRSSSLVYPSTLHLHAQQRVGELMGLGGGGGFSWDSTGFSHRRWPLCFWGERRAVLGGRAKRATSEHLRPQVLHQKQRETKRVHSLRFPRPLFLSTQLHRVLLWVCLTTSSCCWQRGQGSVGSSDSHNRLQ